MISISIFLFSFCEILRILCCNCKKFYVQPKIILLIKEYRKYQNYAKMSIKISYLGGLYLNNPKNRAKYMVSIGACKTQLRTNQVLLLAFMAGMFISFGAIAFNTVTATIENPSIARLLGSLVFPAGLTLVLIGGSELFTGNSMTLPVALYEKQITFKDVLHNWILVFIGNFIGSLFIAILVLYSKTLSLFGGDLALTTIRIAISKSSLVFTQALASGILCNLLVCLAVWLSFAGDSTIEKIAALYLPILVFVLCGFEHCVANMFFIPAGIFAAHHPTYHDLAVHAGLHLEELSWSAFLCNNLLPVTLGNIIGGAIIGLVYAYVYRSTENDT